MARAETEDTFRAIGEDWYHSKANNRSKPWREANRLYLDRNLYPTLGGLPIRDVTAKLLLAVLKKNGKLHGLKTADRIRQTALQVFEHAILKFEADVNPAMQLKRWAELPPKINRPRLAERDIRDLVDAIDAYPGYITTNLAAKLLLLTFVRRTEMVEARWEEFDLPNAKWLIPAPRMKMKEAHVVPLSKQALETLEALKQYGGGSAYVFPENSTPLKPMSRTSLNNMFANMEGKSIRAGSRRMAFVALPVLGLMSMPFGMTWSSGSWRVLSVIRFVPATTMLAISLSGDR